MRRRAPVGPQPFRRLGTTTIDRLLIGLVLAISLYAFDDLALSTILPTVAAELHGDGLYSASFLAFLLCNLGSLVATGYFIDHVGVARPFAAGMLLFAAGLLLGFAAPSMTAFVFGRALQGLGGGAIQAVVSAAIVIAWSGAARQRAISWVTTGWMIPALVGPLVAGWVTEHLHWRYVFAGLTVLAVATAALVLPRLVRVKRETADESAPQALPGAAVMAAVGIALGTGVVLGGLDVGGWPGTVLALGGLLLMRRPLAVSLPDGFWTASTPLAAVLMLRLLACAVFFGIEAWLPWTANRSGLASPVVAGLILSAAAGGWTAATWWVDGAIVRVGAYPILCGASMLLLAGTALAWLAATQIASVPLLFLAWFVAGLAMGLCYPVISTLAMARAERGREGRLSMMLGLTDTIGITAAIGLGGALLRADEPGALERISALWLAFLACAFLLPALLVWRRRHFTATAQA